MNIKKITRVKKADAGDANVLYQKSLANTRKHNAYYETQHAKLSKATATLAALEKEVKANVKASNTKTNVANEKIAEQITAIMRAKE